MKRLTVVLAKELVDSLAVVGGLATEGVSNGVLLADETRIDGKSDVFKEGTEG